MIGLILFAAAFITVQLHVLTMAIAGSALGAKIEDFGISVGPTLLTFKIGSVNFKVNSIPLGGYVKFTEDYQSLAAWKQIIIALSGCLALILLAILLLGLSDGWRHFGRGFIQVLWGALMPLSTGKNLVAALFEFAHHNSFMTCIGLLAAKAAAFNLLPLGLLNGGLILTIALKSIMPITDNLIERYQIISLIIYLLISLSWLIALVSFLLS